MLSFYAHTDNMIYQISKIIPYLGNKSYEIVLSTFKQNEFRNTYGSNGLKLANELNLEDKVVWDTPTTSEILCTFNDWFSPLRKILPSMRKSVCIQEGMIFDINKNSKMMSCTHQFIMSNWWRKYWPDGIVTGNPKFEDFLEKVELPKIPNIMVQCNFTGIRKNIGLTWIPEVINILEKLDYPFFLSRHPYDETPDKLLVNAKQGHHNQLKEHLNKASLFISISSDVLMYACMMGIPAIYYNPMSEYSEGYIGYPLEARNKYELIYRIKQCINDPYLNLNEVDRFWRERVSFPEGGSGRKIAKELLKLC